MKYISLFLRTTLFLFTNKVRLFTEMIANAWFYQVLRKVKDEREFNSLIVAGSVNTHNITGNNRIFILLKVG